MDPLKMEAFVLVVAEEGKIKRKKKNVGQGFNVENFSNADVKGDSQDSPGCEGRASII